MHPATFSETFGKRILYNGIDARVRSLELSESSSTATFLRSDLVAKWIPGSKFFLRFAVIFLRPPVIPLIPPLIVSEPPMRSYRRTSAENWSWPPLFVNEKPFLCADIPQKSAGKIFWYWCRKMCTLSENQISPKEKQKTLQCFLFQIWGYRTPKPSPRNVNEKIGKIKFHTKNRHSVPSSSTLFVKMKIVRQLNLLFFFFWLTLLVFLDVLSLFHIAPYLNLVVWISNWCHFCDTSIKFVSFWVPMEATFSSWFLSSGVSGAR